MRIIFEAAEKTYNKQQIFTAFSYTLESPNLYGIQGLNGSGKSTLLWSAAGLNTLTNGKVRLIDNSTKEIEWSEAHQYFTTCAPYMDMHQDLTVLQNLEFHFRANPMLPDIKIHLLLEMVQISKTKTLKQLSSGMQQRFKLACAILTDKPIILLDEPTSFLDQSAKQWYQKLLLKYRNNRLCIVASNDPFDFLDTPHIVSIEDYKTNNETVNQPLIF